MISIYDIPVELIDLILLYLDFKDVVSCYCAARLFHVVSRTRMQWLRYGPTPIGTIMRYNLLDGLKYKVDKLGQTELLTSDITFRYALMFNRQNIVDYLIDAGFKVDSQHLNYAVQVGHIDLTKHLLNNRKIQFNIYTPFVAVANCTIDELQQLQTLGMSFTNDCVTTVIKIRRYEIVEYLYSLGLRADNAIDAGMTGDVRTLKLLLKHGSKNKGLAFNLAARGGHYAAVKLLYWYGALGSEFSIQQAVRYDYLEIVRYLHFIGISTISGPLSGNSLKMCKNLAALGLTSSNFVQHDFVQHDLSL